MTTDVSIWPHDDSDVDVDIQASGVTLVGLHEKGRAFGLTLYFEDADAALTMVNRVRMLLAAAKERAGRG